MKIMASGPITSWQIDGETVETVRLYFGGLQNHCRWWLQPWNEKMFAPWKKSYDQPRQHIKKQRHYFANKGWHVWMWELDYKKKLSTEELMLLTVVLEKNLETVPWMARIANQFILKAITPEYSLKDWCWSCSSNTLDTWYEELTH